MPERRITAVALSVAMVAVAVLVPLAGCQSLTGSKSGQVAPPQLTPAPGQQEDRAPAVGSSPGLQADKSTESQSGGGGGTASSTQETKPMVVRDKTLTMEVDGVRKTLAKLNTLSSKYHASITSSSISSSGGGGPQPMQEGQGSSSTTGDETGPLSGTVVIKVPVDKFDSFVTAVRKFGKVQSESESTEDVTQQHIDMKARLKNLKAEEAALQRFFRSANNVREMLTIEQELARVRGEIESLQGQIDYLERRATMATLTLNLSEPGGIVTPSGENWGFVDAIRQAIRAFVGVINFLIIMTGALLPILIIGLIGFWTVRWLLRRFVFKKKSE